MKKLLLGLLLSALLVFGANDVKIVGNTALIEKEFTEILIDTFTITLNQGDVRYTFHRPWYNVFVTKINCVDDSTHGEVWTSTKVVGLENANSVGQAYLKHTVGDNKEADTVKFYIGIYDLNFSPTKGDSTAADTFWTVEVRGVR